MSVDTSAINDMEEWQSLSNEEQSEILQEGFEKAESGGSGSSDRNIPNWEEVDEVSQEQTLAALQGALDDTWTAKVFEGDDSQKTIPFEMRQMTEEQQDSVTEWMDVFAEMKNSGVDSLDELEDNLDQAGELLDMLDDFDPWLNQFLADLSVGEHFTVEWWSRGKKLPAGTKLQLFYTVFERHQDQSKNTQSFR